jgi:Ca2+-binding RTX toxin-like protein
MTVGGGRSLLSCEEVHDLLTGGVLRDVLGGGPGRDRLLGGRGNDDLHGGKGTDRLLGGRGNDILRPADGSPDVVNGGAGRDVASYAGWKRAVTVTVGEGGGTGSERDAFTSIENLGGGEDSDSLVGDDAANRIWGGGGEDAIDARGGDDVVDVRGASTAAGSVDVVCGEGADLVAGYEGNDRVLVRGDCEKINFPSAGVRFDPRPGPPSGRTVQLSLPCAAPGDPDDSRVVTVKTPGAGRLWFQSGPYDVQIATGTLTRGAASNAICQTPVVIGSTQTIKPLALKL